MTDLTIKQVEDMFRKIWIAEKHHSKRFSLYTEKLCMFYFKKGLKIKLEKKDGNIH